MLHYRITEAILNLRPGASISVADDDFDRVEVHDATVLPTVAEVQAELDRLDGEFEATAYRRARAAAYSEISDQLDMIYWDAVNNTTVWREHVVAVKARFPKPT